MPVEVKEVADRTLEMAGSTEDKDRMGDIIRSSGWKLSSFKKNPVFMWVHDYSKPPIGRANKVWVDKETNRLMFNVEFASPEVYEFADTIYKLYKGGFLHATSVGFIPLEWEGKDEEHPIPNWEGNVFTKQELLELSAVPVPANANALVSARDEGLITVKEFEALSREVTLAVVTKPEETENYYRIPVKGEEGKHKGHRIRTIDIDKKKGIKALYCGECKKIITYLFDKDKWDSMEDCQEWVDEHSKDFDESIATIAEAVISDMALTIDAEMLALTKGAIPYKKTPLDETGEWDAGKEVRNAEVDDLKIMCTWVDSENAENKTAYKLPHHRAGGEHICVWRAVAACAAVIMGARGGADIPDADMGGVKAHIAKHYKDFDKGDPPWEKGITQEQIMDDVAFLRHSIETCGLAEKVMSEALNLANEIIMRAPGSDIPDDILSKVGAVLNQKNRDRLEQIQSMAQDILDSANKPNEDGNKHLEPPEPIHDPAQRARDVAEVAQMVIAMLKGKRIR